MTNVHVVINGTVEFSGDPGEYKNQPPDLFRDMLKPGGTLKPWLNHVALAMSDGLKAGVDISIEVEHRSNRWSMKVEQR